MRLTVRENQQKNSIRRVRESYFSLFFFFVSPSIRNSGERNSTLGTFSSPSNTYLSFGIVFSEKRSLENLYFKKRERFIFVRVSGNIVAGCNESRNVVVIVDRTNRLSHFAGAARYTWRTYHPRRCPRSVKERKC